jgi:hypothetical protein
MKDAKSLLFYFSIVVTIFIVNYIISTIHPSAKGNDPIFWWSGQCVTALFLLGYVLHSWKSNMSEFLKRIRVTIPFALMFLIFIKIMGFGNRGSITAGLIVCILLLFKTPNWKRHFAAILIPATIFIILFRFLLIPLDRAEGSLLEVTFYVTCIMPILSFFLLYMSKLEHAETPALRPILVRTVKFSIAVSLFFAAFLILSDFFDKQEISLPIQILVSSLLTIFFAGVCYKFDLFLVERKKKKNRVDELHEELEGLYLEEKVKIKK